MYDDCSLHDTAVYNTNKFSNTRIMPKFKKTFSAKILLFRDTLIDIYNFEAQHYPV